MNRSSDSAPQPQVTRRGFLGTASRAVAGGALLGALPVDRFALGAAADDTLKIALIGCGGRGSGATNQALQTGNVKLVAMADAFKDRLESSLANLKNQHPDKVEVTPDRQFVGLEGYKQAIDLADVVVLAAPPGFRPMHYEYAVEKGKHAFLEKPVATDGPGIRRMLKAHAEAKKKNLKGVVGLQRHYQPSYIETLKRLHEGAIGRIAALRCYWNDGGVWVKEREANQTEMEYQLRNWYYFVWLSGDHIVEQHVHNIDVGNWVMAAQLAGEEMQNRYPVKCHGMGGRQVRTGKEYGEIYDHHAVEFEYKDGTRMFSQCRHIKGCWTSVSEHAIGTEGTCDVGGGLIRAKAMWRFRPDKAVDPYQKEHDVLFDAIRNNKPCDDVENGIRSTLSGIMGRMATYSGQQILLEDALNSEINLLPEKLDWKAMPKLLPDKDGVYPIAVPGKTSAV